MKSQQKKFTVKFKLFCFFRKRNLSLKLAAHVLVKKIDFIFFNYDNQFLISF